MVTLMGSDGGLALLDKRGGGGFGLERMYVGLARLSLSGADEMRQGEGITGITEITLGQLFLCGCILFFPSFVLVLRSPYMLLQESKL